MADGYDNYSVLDADIFTGVASIMVILFVRKFEHNLPLFVCEQKIKMTIVTYVNVFKFHAESLYYFLVHSLTYITWIWLIYLL